MIKIIINIKKVIPKIKINKDNNFTNKKIMNKIENIKIMLHMVIGILRKKIINIQEIINNKINLNINKNIINQDNNNF